MQQPDWLALPTVTRGRTLRIRLHSTQGAAELVLQIAIASLALALAAGAVRSLTVNGLPAFALSASLTALLLGVALSGYALWVVHRRSSSESARSV
jgi:hypothetical protein